ncbi:MAG: hypothetical protein ACRCYY_06800 [Trueperaceae bacterium]
MSQFLNVETGIPSHDTFGSLQGLIPSSGNVAWLTGYATPSEEHARKSHTRPTW